MESMELCATETAPKMLPRMVGAEIHDIDTRAPKFVIGRPEDMAVLVASIESGAEKSESIEMKLSVAKEVLALLGAYIPNVSAQKLLAGGEYEAMACICPVKDKEDVVVGACAYKPHETFIELALFCIDICCQGHGLGRKLMERLEKRGLEDLGANVIFAYADTKALPFFKRQHFSRIISTDPSLFRKKIVAYNEARIMEKVLRKIDHAKTADLTPSSESLHQKSHLFASGSQQHIKKRKKISCTTGLSTCYCHSGRTRAIERYDPVTMQTLEVYCSASGAARKLGLSNCSVTHVTNGFAQNARGYYFRYVDDLPFLTGRRAVVYVVPVTETHTQDLEHIQATPRKFCGVNNHLLIKQYFSSAKEASRHFFPSSSSKNGDIGACCNGYVDEVQGKIFRWAEDRVHPCAICSSDASAAELLLCDGMDQRCTSTAHISCLNLDKVPDGEWYCPCCEARRSQGIDVHKAVPYGKPRGYFATSSHHLNTDDETNTKKKIKPSAPKSASPRKKIPSATISPTNIIRKDRAAKRAAAAGVARAVRAAQREGSATTSDEDSASSSDDASPEMPSHLEKRKSPQKVQSLASPPKRPRAKPPTKSPRRETPPPPPRTSLPRRARTLVTVKPAPPPPPPQPTLRSPSSSDAMDEDLHHRLRIQQHNPKRAGSMSHTRYDAYKSAKTIGEFLQLGGTRADLRNDVPKGYIEFFDGCETETNIIPPSQDDDDDDDFWRPKDTKCFVLFREKWYHAYVFQYTDEHVVFHYLHHKGQASIINKQSERHLVRWDTNPP